MRTRLLLGMLLIAVPTLAEWPIQLPKDLTVVLKVPERLWKDEKSVSFGGQQIYSIDADAVLSQKSWETSDFPYMSELKIAKAWRCRSLRLDCKKGATEVELRNEAVYIKLGSRPRQPLWTPGCAR